MKNLECSEENAYSEIITLKAALLKFRQSNEMTLKALKMQSKNSFVPNQHIYMAHIKNCKSLEGKLK